MKLTDTVLASSGPARNPGRPAALCLEPPWPWDWAGMSAEAAEEMWGVLVDFVAFLDARYAWSAEQLIPACWAEHGALVEELTTLYWSRANAFQSAKPTIELAQTWHHQTLPGFYQRLKGWLGAEGGACRAGQHPATSPATEVDQAAAAARCAERRRQVVTADLRSRTSEAQRQANGATSWVPR